MVKELILILITDLYKASQNLQNAFPPFLAMTNPTPPTSPLPSPGVWGFVLMVFQSVRLLIRSNLSRYWDLSTLLIHAFADGDGNPSMTSGDPEGNAFTSSIALNLGPYMSRRRESVSFKNASVTYVLGNMSQ